MNFECIIYEKADRVATITLNRPDKMNAIGGTLQLDLVQALEDADSDAAVGALVITGAGKGFCSGADVSALAGTAQRASSSQAGSAGRADSQSSSKSSSGGGINLIAHTMSAFEKPSIAAINGAAAGAGLSLALSCDIRIASDRARFSQIFIRRGLVPDSGSGYFLPRAVGMSRACEMVFTGDILDAAQALEYGLVSRVLPHDDLLGEVHDLAARIALGPTGALKMAKRILYHGVDGNLDDTLELESELQGICFGTDDFKEGVAAFMEKRQANFHSK